MSNPDPKEFATTVLACLASLHGEIWMLRKQLTMTGTLSEEHLAQLEKEIQPALEAYYREMLVQCGLKDNPPPPFLFRGRAGDPTN